ncbi:MAG: RNA 2',3'-cyclic phosphodiesterase [Parvularculaceae bacterium]
MHRLFVALALPDDVIDALVELQNGLRGARWLAPDNFHLTLAFIGETDRHGFNEVASALSSIAAPGFDLRLKGCGFFGDRKPRALWAGVEANAALMHLQSKVCVALRRAGFADEKRKFSPHVTLAYLNGMARNSAAEFCAVNGLFSAGPFAVDAFHLFESHLGSEGAHYEIAETYRLQRFELAVNAAAG